MRERRIITIIKKMTAIFIGGFLLIFASYFLGFIGKPFLTASFYGGILNLINSVLAFVLLEYSYQKSNKVFMISVFGGMGVRLLALLFTIFIFIAFLNIDKYGFILTFFIFYFILIALEINYLLIRAKKKENSK